MGVYAAIVGEKDLRKGLMIAVNHSGDSDSTGAIAGNILGAMHGEQFFSLESLDEVELRGEILSLADDLYDAWDDQPSLTDRYRVKRGLGV